MLIEIFESNIVFCLFSTRFFRLHQTVRLSEFLGFANTRITDYAALLRAKFVDHRSIQERLFERLVLFILIFQAMVLEHPENILDSLVIFEILVVLGNFRLGLFMKQCELF